jgi:hypothetical protein
MRGEAGELERRVNGVWPMAEVRRRQGLDQNSEESPAHDVSARPTIPFPIASSHGIALFCRVNREWDVEPFSAHFERRVRI